MWRTLAIASAFFPGLFVLCIRLLRWAAPGWSLKDRILLSGRLVSTVQATMATVSGITVVLNCKDVVHDRHWLAVEYIWVLVPYMTYDIYVMYLCHWHKSLDKGVAEKKHSLASIWSFLLQERLMVTHHLFILIVLTPITQHFRGELGDFFVGCIFIAELSTPFVSLGKILMQVAQNAGHSPPQGERDHHLGDFLRLPHSPLPFHVRSLRQAGGDPRLHGAFPHPPALQHSQRLPHRSPALLVQAHLPQSRPALRQLTRRRQKQIMPPSHPEQARSPPSPPPAPGSSTFTTSAPGTTAGAELCGSSRSTGAVLSWNNLTICIAVPAWARRASFPRCSAALCPPTRGSRGRNQPGGALPVSRTLLLDSRLLTQLTVTREGFVTNPTHPPASHGADTRHQGACSDAGARSAPGSSTRDQGSRVSDLPQPQLAPLATSCSLQLRAEPSPGAVAQISAQPVPSQPVPDL